MERIARRVALVLACAVLGGCGSAGPDAPPPLTNPDFATPKPLSFRSEAVKADRHVSNTITVADGQLTLPIGNGDPGGSNDAFVAKLHVGSVVAGDRDTSTRDLASSKNPYGFLRRVTGIDRTTNSVVIHTQQAYLNELFHEGDLVWDPKHPRGSIFDDAGTSVTTTSLQPRDDGTQPSSGSGTVDADTTFDDPEHNANAEFRPTVSLSNTRVGLDTTFSGQLQIRDFFGVPYGVAHASMRLDLDPVVTTDITYGVKAQASDSLLGGALHAEFDSPSVPIAVLGPIPVTVRLSARIVCSVEVSGSITLTSRVWLRGHAAAGFNYDGGDIQPIADPPTLSAGHELLGWTGQASLIGQCAIQGVVSLMAFDAIGLQGSIGPYAQLEADLCATGSTTGGTTNGLTVWEQHGLEVDVGGRIQIPIVGTPLLEKDIFGLQPLKSDPIYFVGDEHTCAPKALDSCVDKPDGTYCSDLAPFSAYTCVRGDIASGQQCAGGQRCAGPNGPGTVIQCK
ncbi:MAG TPA: hypothetical protein VIF62_36410 [Labilithrix sp.]|jgi:hypothetical protein